MSEVPRIAVDDLIAEFELHPGRRHLYVEGEDDRSLLSWLLNYEGERVKIYSVDSVEVLHVGSGSAEVCGARGRVIELARTLEQRFPVSDNLPFVRCLADRDFDEILGREVSSSYLVLTDFTAMELYAFDFDVVSEVVNRGVGLPNVDVHELLASLEDVLVPLFVARATNLKLGWGLSWLSPHRRFCLDSDSRVSCDTASLRADYVRGGGRWKDREEFEAVLREMEGLEFDDVRHRIRGHDFVEVLSWFLRNSVRGSGAASVDERTTWFLLRTALHRDRLLRHGALLQLTTLYAR